MQIPERTLIYDRDISGHHLDYLQFLVEYIKNKPIETRRQFVFVLNEGAKARFENDEKWVTFRYIETKQLTIILSHTNVLKRAAAEMKYLIQLVGDYQVKRLIFMHIDAFQFELGRAAARDLGIKFSGPLFLPFRKEYEDGHTLVAKLKRELRGLRKGLQIRWMLRNTNLERIFFLNDKKGAQVYNEKYGERFAHLPDPIEVGVFASSSVSELREKYGIEENRRIFLIYGHLSSRKNVPNILAALKSVEPAKRRKITFLICGEPESGYEKILFSSIEDAEKKYKDVRFVKFFRFFDPTDTNEVFKIADVVLIPYINFFSSSNILGLAAKYNKPLIASNLGVMEGLVNHYKLGVTVSPHRPEAIAEGMNVFLESKETCIDGQEYLQDHAAEVFCEKLLL